MGPAFVAAVAYVDPGNVAANLDAGAGYGYLLVWVLVVANVMAMLVQYLSAKLGLVTGHSLPEIVGEALPRRGSRLAYWFQAELVAAATDLAEVIGGAVALQLLFGLPLIVGGVITGALSLAILAIPSRHGQRTFEIVIIGMLVVITIGFTAGLVLSPLSWGGVASGLVPRFEGTETVVLATSMLGATVMPHAVYMHSSLVRDRHGVADRPSRIATLLRATRWDVAVSLVLAGSVNIAMLLLAAASLQGIEGIDGIAEAHAAMSDSMGPVVGLIFAVGLFASGLASTSVGAYAGAEIMAGLLHIRVPMLVRRLVTIIPALIILASGANPTRALVWSQVLLSMGLPLVLVPLARFTGDRRLMGQWANGRVMAVIAWTVVAAVSALNVVLVVETVMGA
ncbi:Nramp family divalent metal transporter [Cutibacterium modestum]|jgi:manganese transport protein|uniref:Divalent metal cation transporter MntH n=2 Tax=Cutibacterium modestum TaxID=2559073 RepID=A0AAD1KRA6_9ACTN|nr:Nramp family divalent metal transporter [Cutibacterium modestum]AOH45906.1 divalent metal cation transporter [Cutibacterium modestum]EFS74106.1 metal ion transporter, metal ion (Mn2+/Fe2+) transporter (Nramp) family [Cutibacterium modestum HL037PA2]EFS92688.1 metal ion transporter, metal ion (Mn2+/Fe2+) transporter (Nramp) family [Cutibacterium modestum HL044PA1]EFT15363.1 metal ion transporter, metal ion (Mn2+/Fe2+) transporter (Nramp) family [Cutibacterium modestum HL037PA3]EGG26171.1 man